jgi:hypothetical protein
MRQPLTRFLLKKGKMTADDVTRIVGDMSKIVSSK